MSWGTGLLCFCAFALAASWAEYARSEDGGRPLYVIYDNSNSMWGSGVDGAPKHSLASKAITSITWNALARRKVFFRVYGSDKAQRCADTKLLSEAPNDSAEKHARQISELPPAGKSALDLSLRLAAKDLKGQPADILLFSDGIIDGGEGACPGDPCELLEAWEDAGTPYKVRIVDYGQGIEGQLECISKLKIATVLPATNLNAFLKPAPVPTSPARVPKPETAPKSVQQPNIFNALWTNINAAQATLLSSLIGVLGTGLGLVIGYVFLQNRVKRVQRALADTRDEFEELLASISGQLSEVDKTTRSTRATVDGVQKELAEISSSNVAEVQKSDSENL